MATFIYISETGNSVNDYYITSTDLFALIYSSCRLYVADRIESDHFPIEFHVRFPHVNGPVMNTFEQTNFIDKFQ